MKELIDLEAIVVELQTVWNWLPEEYRSPRLLDVIDRLRAAHGGRKEADTEPVNWKASYHQACDDADAYKADAEKRLAKMEQNWRSCQHEIEYLRARLALAGRSAAGAETP